MVGAKSGRLFLLLFSFIVYVLFMFIYKAYGYALYFAGRFAWGYTFLYGQCFAGVFRVKRPSFLMKKKTKCLNVVSK